MEQRSFQRLGIVIGVLLLLVIGPFLVAPLFSNENQELTRSETLEFWGVHQDEAYYTGVIESFEAEHPTVAVNYRKFRDIDELENDLVNELAEGKGPDIVTIDPSWTIKHRKKFATMPSNMQLGDPDVFKATFLPFAKELIVDENGTDAVFAVPYMMDTLALIYNEDYFLQNLSSAKPADTWSAFTVQMIDEVRTNSTKNRIRSTPLAMGRTDNIRRGMDVLHSIMLQYGTSFYDDAFRQVTISNPVLTSGANSYPAITALNFFARFATPGDEYFAWSTEQTEDYPRDAEIGAFLRGEIGVIFGYSYLLADLEDLATDYLNAGETVIDTTLVRAAPLPQMTSSTSASNQKATLALYYPLAVPQVSDNQGSAWEFAELLSSEDVARYYFNRYHAISPRVSMLTEQSRDPIYGPFASQAGFAQSLFVPEYESLNAIYDDLLDDLYDGRTDVIDVITNLQDQWQCLMRDINPDALPALIECP